MNKIRIKEFEVPDDIIVEVANIITSNNLEMSRNFLSPAGFQIKFFIFD